MNIDIYKNIGEAYFNVVKHLREHGKKVPIDRGSYEKELFRIQVPFIAFGIEFPNDFGWLADPHLPVSLTHEQIEEYFVKYLMSEEKADNETYRYGNRALKAEQLYKVIEMLQKGYTNQAAIAIEEPSDISLSDPPCLRSASFNVEPGGVINLSVFWRSWDCLNGLPLNLSGLTRLFEFVVGCVENRQLGTLFVAASNPHYYSNVEHIVDGFLSGSST